MEFFRKVCITSLSAVAVLIATAVPAMAGGAPQGGGQAVPALAPVTMTASTVFPSAIAMVGLNPTFGILDVDVFAVSATAPHVCAGAFDGMLLPRNEPGEFSGEFAGVVLAAGTAVEIRDGGCTGALVASGTV